MHLEKILSAEESLACEPYRPVAAELANEVPNPRWAIAWRILTAFARLRWKRSLLLWLRFLAYPQATLGWWRWLAEVVASRNYPLPHDDLLQKPLMKFLAHGLSGPQRLGLLIGHFGIAEKILSRDSMVRLWQGGTLAMGEVQGRSERYRCLLMLADRSDGARPLRSAFFRGWAGGLGYFAVSVWWVTEAFLVDADFVGVIWARACNHVHVHRCGQNPAVLVVRVVPTHLGSPRCGK